ncbi:MAG: IclR family transcriptional regulator [Candidatus Acidiferrum sp.]
MAGMHPKGKRTYNITALQRGLDLLKLFAGAENGLSPSVVTKLSHLPVSTVHRFLTNLQASGFLSSDNTGVYHLGIACITLGHAARGKLDVRRASLPYLQELNRQTRETVHLTVRNALSAVYVEKLDSLEPLRIHSRIGASVPLHCTAVGKILLAYLPAAEQAAVLNELVLRRFTENTVSNLQELQTQLSRVRRDGFACDLEEHESHIRCVAAPIWDHTGAVNASLSITGPAVRMATARIKQIASLISAAGKKISVELGYIESASPEAKRNPGESRRPWRAAFAARRHSRGVAVK